MSKEAEAPLFSRRYIYLLVLTGGAALLLGLALVTHFVKGHYWYVLLSLLWASCCFLFVHRFSLRLAVAFVLREVCWIIARELGRRGEQWDEIALIIEFAGPCLLLVVALFELWRIGKHRSSRERRRA